LDDKLNFVEEPVEIMDREVKQLKQSRIPIVKVRWNSKRGPELTWEREDQIRAKAPRSKDNRNWNQGSSTKAVKIEDASEKAMCAIDGAGFDWSDMAEEEI
ncbi:hypothetical protein Tco_0179923, partial [Tanacetum coccineum]